MKYKITYELISRIRDVSPTRGDVRMSRKRSLSWEVSHNLKRAKQTPNSHTHRGQKRSWPEDDDDHRKLRRSDEPILPPTYLPPPPQHPLTAQPPACTAVVPYVGGLNGAYLGHFARAAANIKYDTINPWVGAPDRQRGDRGGADRQGEDREGADREDMQSVVYVPRDVTDHIEQKLWASHCYALDMADDI